VNPATPETPVSEFDLDITFVASGMNAAGSDTDDNCSTGNTDADACASYGCADEVAGRGC
jgi:FxLD family lantipeptide